MLKKRFFVFFVFITVLCSLFPAFAQTTGGKCGENVNYMFDFDTGHLSISGMGNMRQYTKNSVAPWYSFRDEIVSVSIENGVTSIGDYSFFWCGSLNSVTISSSVKTIGNSAFYNCDALTAVTIPEGVERIEDEAFQNCTGLEEVFISGSVKNIGKSAFYNCYISEEESEIGIESGLKKVVMEDGIETIGDYAFCMCEKLNDITIPESVTSIGYWAFYNTGRYNEWWNGNDDVLYIGSHLITVSQSKSSACDITDGTKTVADYAFSACWYLPDITIPDSVVSIGSHAFDGCNSLKSIIIPQSVKNIGECAFYTCFDLQSINVDPNNSDYCSENGVLYNKERTEMIRFPKEKQTASFTIPTGVTKIADGAFENCQCLISITVPEGVTSIGNNAFENCDSLINITLPKSVETIGRRAFMNCSDLRSIIIPDGVPNIGESAFSGCSGLTSITIPKSVLIIGENAFEKCRKSIKVYYIGSKNNWKNITGTGKYVLNNVSITYLAPFTESTVVQQENGAEVTVLQNLIPEESSIYVAGYDRQGRMTGVKTVSVSAEEQTALIPGEVFAVRVFVWNENQTPYLAEPETIEKDEFQKSGNEA